LVRFFCFCINVSKFRKLLKNVAMNFWSNYPFSRVCLPFLLGIVLEIYFPSFQFFHVYISVIIFGVFLLAVFALKHYKFQWIIGVLLFAMLYIFGKSYVGVYTKQNHESHYTKHINSEDKLAALLVIDEPLLEKPKSLQVKGSVLALYQENKTTVADGKLLVYLQKDSNSLNLSVGDTLLLYAQLNEISGVQNPGQFNYKRFLRFHQIYHQAYCSSEFWQLAGKNESFSLLAFADDFRKEALNILKQSGLGEDEFAVASALILGFKESLDDELVWAYSNSGAMHVLAVSGLHVGIVFMVLNFLLSFLDKSKKAKWIKAIFLLLGVWFYAFVTGLSPSVLRAATMLSFIIIAGAVERNTNIFNTLFASAFFLLILNPYLIMQVGFQLSYLAVIGIVYIQPRLYKQLYFKNWLLDKIWAITAVSIAAQIATFPLGLLYFHQFPNYFFVSNLVVIPAATIILGLGIIVLLCYKISALFYLLGKLLHYTIYILNASVFAIEDLPYSLTTGISISVFECWLIYLAIIFLIAFFVLKKNNMLYFTLASLIAILFIDAREDMRLQKQSKLIVYNIKNSTAINFISGSSNYFISDSTTFYDNSTMLFNVKHNWDDLDLNAPVFINLEDSYESKMLLKEKHFVQFLNTKLLIVDETFFPKNIQETINVDYVLYTNNAKLKIDDLLKMFSFNHLILDGSMKESTAKKIAAYASKKGISSYITSERGAFELDIIYRNSK
jgi:competence protein ComEC